METKQTAVEWLVEKLQSKEFIYGDRSSILNHAKEMEKKAIIDFAWEMSGLTRKEIEEEYYEKFKNKDE